MNCVALGHPDHDSCGTGFITRLGKPATHEVIERALLALRRLAHRGASDADGSSGDGAGLMTALPDEFFRRCADELGLTLPATFGVGMLFLPPNSHSTMRRTLEEICEQAGLRFLGWREVPTDSSTLGPQSKESAPSVWQCFLAPPGVPSGRDADLESLLFLFRKRVEAAMGPDVYFCSLSSRTIVYKGLLTPGQLSEFYPDLVCPDFASPFAIFHQRFSTNTRPAWRLAQPFRFLAHNGEINTVVGNRRWLQAREAAVRTRLQAGAWFHCLEPDASDSASLDNGVELLLRQGHSIQAGLLTLVPPAFELDWRLEPEVRNYLEDAANQYEPWDGPAALVFSDGHVLGAKLDRNGLRPLRYQRTSDGWLVAGSEAGIADFSRREIVERQRLGPGEMLMVEIASGRVYRNGELLRVIAEQGIGTKRSPAFQLRAASARTSRAVDDPRQLAAAVGWTEDQLRLLLQPLAEGKEPIWSMGDDTPPAFMSQFRRTLWDYCKQRFAQVTNPAIDPLRESHVMSLRTRIGREFVADSPLLSGAQLLFLRGCFAPCRTIDATFPVSEGLHGAREALERIGSAVRGQRLVVLSDRGTNQERAALPILVAASAAWRAMVEAGKCDVPLIVETAQVVDTHHVALLIAVGATGVCPFLALQLAEETQPNGAENFHKGINAGLRKVLSRMGISTLASYRNSQLFETVGLDHELCEEFFESATSVAHEKSLDEVLANYLQNHSAAFNAESAPLKDLGLYRYRKEGERHGTSPELMRKMQVHVKTRSQTSYQEIEDLGRKREPLAIRDMLKLSPREPVDLDTVESETAILRRFSTQAMSLGAISPEAHRALAQAVNSLGARSNTGEGGEDPDLYKMDPQSCNKIKQIASARFGVTAEYLVHAQEIEIKIAQGSKPGEGGQLPAAKVSPYIARLRHAVPGMALISPPPHHDIYSIEDLGQLIHDLREVNPLARIGVKLVAGAGVGIIAAGVAKAGADVITISGHDGGTGASPLSSIKNTGLPWEFGLRDAHRTLTQCGLRGRVRLRVDGGLKFARDILVAALLGADEFGFGTAALLAMGCVMARQCHLNTCPVGIATQDEALRMRFAGKPEMVMAYFQGVAAEVRLCLSRAGARSIDEIVGHGEYLQASSPEQPWVKELLAAVPTVEQTPRPARHRNGLAREILKTAKTSRVGTFHITNQDRSIGAGLSGEMLRCLARHKSADLTFEGVAGQSFGAFLVAGVHLQLLGEANDYVGKGLSGGVIAISAGAKASLRGDVLAGNTVLYGATSGELYLAGAAGERFAVRNSGALAVVEGVGDHGCEYMTGGVALILGPTGINLGSGMTGGLIYLPADQFADNLCNLSFVQPAPCTNDEESNLRQALARHLELTGSPRAESLLDARCPLRFTRVQPVHLPCPVSQTWAPILDRLKRYGVDEHNRPTALKSPALASLAMRPTPARNRPPRLREY